LLLLRRRLLRLRLLVVVLLLLPLQLLLLRRGRAVQLRGLAWGGRPYARLHRRLVQR
jgi:hypothetical protein